MYIFKLRALKAKVVLESEARDMREALMMNCVPP